jgi:hypothetical protein
MGERVSHTHFGCLERARCVARSHVCSDYSASAGTQVAAVALHQKS